MSPSSARTAAVSICLPHSPDRLPAFPRRRVVNSEAARRSTHGVVEGFGLNLVREPWPLWAPLPVSAVLLPLLVLLLVAAVARERIQRRVAAGGERFTGLGYRVGRAHAARAHPWLVCRA
jgi:hypothetical protein